MNITQSNKHFEKLTSFYKQISADGEINNIELDLLKSYTLSFYESIIGATGASSATVKTHTVAAPVAPVVAPKAVKKETIAEQAPPEPVVESSNGTKQVAHSSELESLFSLSSGNEISDKLSKTPIKDITKAMSINERIFTIKELFGGSQENFDKTMTGLNGLSTYDEAKAFLAEKVVNDNGWLNPDKSKKVKTFLKLIARKYV